MRHPRDVRKALFHMTQKQFGNRLGRSQPSVSDWEMRGRFPSDVLSDVRGLGCEQYGNSWDDAWLFEPPQQPKEGAAE